VEKATESLEEHLYDSSALSCRGDRVYALRASGDTEVMELQRIPVLSRYCPATVKPLHGDESGRLHFVDVIDPRRKDGSFHSSQWRRAF
jgi:hypothetical protein